MFGFFSRRTRSKPLSDAISSLPSIDALLQTRSCAKWDETAVPVEKRGVSRIWLTSFITQLQKELNADTPTPHSFHAAGPPANAEVHRARERAQGHFQFLNAHGLVAEIIKPLTAQLRSPLYALVPEAFRGPPATFVSHTWSSLLIGPERQKIGTLNALESQRSATRDEFIWIDFVCYNQHVFKSISSDMARVISCIGSLTVAATPTPLYTRSWCLWELLSTRIASTATDLRVYPGFRNDKILCVNALYKSFAGIASARSTSAVDQRAIYKHFIRHFGSAAQSDAAIRTLIERHFADPWFELQDRHDKTTFSAQPYAWQPQAGGRAAAVPYFLPGLLESRVFGQNLSILELFRSCAILPPDFTSHGEAEQVSDSRQAGDTLVGPEIIPAGMENHYKRVAGDAVVLSTRGSDEASSNKSFMIMRCPRCNREIQYLPRPYYEQSGDPDSLWAAFLDGTRANQCVCGLPSMGAPSVFAASTWTAVTLEPPMGRSLPAERYGLLVKELLTGRKSCHPLLIFESDEVLSASLNSKSRAPFLTVPYAALLYSDAEAAKQRLMIASSAAVDQDRPDLAYSMLRNACLIHNEMFFLVEPEMLTLARTWDALNEPSPIFATTLMQDFDVLKQALEPLRKAPWLDARLTFVCFPTGARVAMRDSRCRSAMPASFDANQSIIFDRDTSAFARAGDWIELVPSPSERIERSLDVDFLAASEYLANNGVVLTPPHAAELRECKTRLDLAQSSSTLTREQWAELSEQYVAAGGRDLQRAIRAR